MEDVRFHVSPSLLDKFVSYLDSDESWQQFYGFSDEPSMSEDEWSEKLRQELIDAVNGVETPSSPAADLGTCLNEAVDCILLHVPSTRADVFLKSATAAGIEQGVDLGGCIFAVKGDNQFMFHTEDVVNLTTHVARMVPQDFVTGTIDTKYGKVQLYGYPDYFSTETGDVIDLKTTSRYEGWKFENKMQRYIYPYILLQSGKINSFHHFTFLVCKVGGNNSRNPFVELELFKETYTDPVVTFETKLANIVELFIGWYIQQMKDGVCGERLCGERK